MAEPTEPGPLWLLPRTQLLQSHGFGLRAPILLLFLQMREGFAWDTTSIAETLHRQGGLKREDVARRLEGGFTVEAFLSLLLAFETAAHTPVTRAGLSVLPEAPQGGWASCTVAVPCSIIKATQAFAEGIVLAVNEAHAAASGVDGVASAKSAFDEGRAVLDRQRHAIGLNMQRLARACSELNLPWHALPGGFIHCGSGPSARLFQSTKSEETSALAVALARSKSGTNALLSLQGLPVPRHRLVSSEDDAARVAASIGYPVVVKPDDLDGGEGVHAGLQDEAQVRQYYRDASALSSRVLVEQHIEGLDFRITVDNGRVVKAIGRRPGGIEGDGERNVEALALKAAEEMPPSRMKSSIVTLDEEAMGLLAERGMDAQSVPPKGEFIALRRRANMSTGGMAYDVIGVMHPDNERLAIRAAQALRLDLAGIDLIIPDIAVSWMECKAGICEVNAQPQISTEFAPEVYRNLLRRMVPAPGRIRAVFLLSESDEFDADIAVQKASRRLQDAGERVFSVRRSGTWLNEERIGPAGDPFRLAKSAEFERDATAAVVALTPEQVLQAGVPWLHLDELRILRHPDRQASTAFRAALNMVRPHLVQGAEGAAA